MHGIRCMRIYLQVNLNSCLQVRVFLCVYEFVRVGSLYGELVFA